MNEIYHFIIRQFKGEYCVVCAVDHGVMQGYIESDVNQTFIVLKHPQHGDMYVNPSFITSIREIEEPKHE